MNLILKNVYKSYDLPVLNNLSVTLNNKKIIAIIGPSGGGKSTLLRLLAGLEKVDFGNIKVNNYDLNNINQKEYFKHIGFVFQQSHLFPHLTVLKNLTLILEKTRQMTLRQAEIVVQDLLKNFGLEHVMNKKPHEISGGQAQRVAIVRALMIEPEILFFDEPTSALDPVLTNEVLNSVLKLKDQGKEFLIVTHEIGFARQVADYILFVDDGIIKEHGSVDMLDEPKTDELKYFLSKVFSW